MHEVGPRVGGGHHGKHFLHLGGVTRGQTLERQGDGPDEAMLGVGGADAVELLALEVEGVILREDEAAGVLVDGIVGGAVAQVGGGKEGGDVGVVHKVVVAQTVGLVGVDAAVLGVIHHAVLLDTRVDLTPQLLGAEGQGLVGVDLPGDLSQVAQDHHGVHLGGDEVVVGAGVVRGTEARPGHAGVAHGGAVAAVGQGVGGLGRLGALEGIGRLLGVVLLGLPEIQDDLQHLFVVLIQMPRPSRLFPELVGDEDHRAEGVHLILALPDPGGAEGQVLHVAAVIVALVEGVGVGVLGDVDGVALDHLLDDVGQLGALGRHGEVVVHLGGGVAEPHGVDITRDDEGRAVIQELGGGLQGVGVALGEEQSQIVAAHLVEPLADGVDLIAEEVRELIHVRISFMRGFLLARCP